MPVMTQEMYEQKLRRRRGLAADKVSPRSRPAAGAQVRAPLGTAVRTRMLLAGAWQRLSRLFRRQGEEPVGMDVPQQGSECVAPRAPPPRSRAPPLPAEDSVRAEALESQAVIVSVGEEQAEEEGKQPSPRQLVHAQSSTLMLTAGDAGSMMQLLTLEQLVVEARHRFLNLVKANLWHQYEEGFVSHSGLGELIEATSLAQDEDMLPLRDWDYLEHHCSIPSYLHVMHRTPGVRVLARHLIHHRLAFGWDVATTFIQAHMKARSPCCGGGRRRSRAGASLMFVCARFMCRCKTSSGTW